MTLEELSRDVGDLVHESATTRVRRVTLDDGSSVVLKSASSEFPVAEERRRLVHEYELLRDLDVPGIPRARGLIETGSAPVLALTDMGPAALADSIPVGGMPLEAFYRVARGLVVTVGRLHSAGVVHRDINPSNVVLSEQGAVGLVDFGIASRLSRAFAEQRTRDLAGTLHFMAPEQTGRTNRAVDLRSDLYAVGATLYAMLTGQPPLAVGTPAAMIHAIIAQVPPPVSTLRPELPPALAALVTKLLRKPMEDRYQSAAGLAHDLERVRRGEREFELGTRDRPVGFVLPQRLYGRSRELAELEQSFVGAAKGGARVMLVTGPSGMGKSALIHEVQQAGAVRGARLTTGKFEPFRRPARGALVQAMRRVLHLALAGSEGELTVQTERLRQAMGQSGALLMEDLPELRLLLGPQSPAPEVSSEENRVRIQSLWVRLVQAFASPSRPLVLFFDDLQWADVASLDVLRELVLDPETAHILLLGAYRDDEVGPDHPLLELLAAWERAGAQVANLSLGPMALDDVQELLTDTLSRPLVQVTPLAQTLFERSGGNPLFIRELLTSLHEEGVFVAEADGFSWDLDQVRNQGVNDTVAQLVTGRLNRLDAQSRDMLHLAACVGTTFGVGLLAGLSSRSDELVRQALFPCLNAGLLVLVGDEHRFAHDRVQEAAYALRDPEARKHVHRAIALHWIEGGAPDDQLLAIVGHVDQCVDLLDEHRDTVRGLYLAAGRRALRVAAYPAAQRWLSAGRALLPAAAWDAYEQALAFHTLGAEVARLCGDFESMDALVATVREHARTPLDALPVDETAILHHVAQNQPQKAVNHAVQALRGLGVKLPADPSPVAVAPALLGAVWQLRRTTVGALTELPEMEDPVLRAALRLMMRTGQAAFVANQNLFIILACRMSSLSMRHGNSTESSWGYMLLAFCIANVMGNREQGWKLAEAALTLMDRANAHDLLAKNYASYWSTLHQWRGPWSEGLEPLRRGRRTATEVGDLEFGNTLAMIESWMVVFLVPADEAHAAQADALAYARRNGGGFQQPCIETLHRLVTDLRGEDASALPLADDPAAWAELAERGNVTNLFLLGMRRGLLALWLGDPREAAGHLTWARKYEESMLGTIVWTEVIWAEAMALCQVWPTVSIGERVTVFRARRKMSGLAKQSPQNYAHKPLILDGAHALATGRLTEGLLGLERGAAAARAGGFGLDAAVALELAGTAARAAGMERSGNALLADAHDAWRSWGVTPKAEALALVLGRRRELPAPATLATRTHERLDLDTVIRATRALSEEIVLDRLVRELVQLLLQNTGAERCLLAVERDDALHVEAWAAVEGEPPPLPAPIDAVDAPAAILSWVARTGESLVLADAAQRGMFTADETVQRLGVRSVLCAPLMNQGRLVALVYLDNNLAPGCFTAERLEMVRILLPQAALSIHNARLYASLERKVAERTGDLRLKNEELAETLQALQDTQAHLVAQQKLAALGALTAGIAHELRNPLNFVINFAGVSDELAEELLEADDEAEVAELVALIRKNVARIGEHGHRAEGIIENMLRHSRATTDTERAVVALNPLVADTVALAVEGMRLRWPMLTLDLVTRYDPEVGAVDATPSDLKRVLVNLVNNALDAMESRRQEHPSFKPRLLVSTSVEGEYNVIRVQDNGPGVPQEVLAQVFEPFFTTKPPGKGTGLGLSISHDIIRRGHGGELTVENLPDGGAAFIVRLPVRDAAS
mgnify:CR=1 FL=1